MPLLPPPEYEPGDIAIQQPTWAEGLMRALGLKGNLPSFLRPKVSAEVTLDDLSRAQYLWLRRTQIVHYRLAGVANVGFPTTVQLGVVGSLSAATLGQGRAMIAIRQLVVSNRNAAAQTLTIGLTPNFAAGIAFNNSASQRDDRQREVVASFTGSSFGLYGTVNGVAAPVISAKGSLTFGIAANAVVCLPVDYVLTGLSLFTIVSGTNENVDVVAVCEERPLLPEEF